MVGVGEAAEHAELRGFASRDVVDVLLHRRCRTSRVDELVVDRSSHVPQGPLEPRDVQKLRGMHGARKLANSKANVGSAGDHDVDERADDGTVVVDQVIVELLVHRISSLLDALGEEVEDAVRHALGGAFAGERIVSNRSVAVMPVFVEEDVDIVVGRFVFARRRRDG